jgi:hypothetical protein
MNFTNDYRERLFIQIFDRFRGRICVRLRVKLYIGFSGWFEDPLRGRLWDRFEDRLQSWGIQ